MKAGLYKIIMLEFVRLYVLLGAPYSDILNSNHFNNVMLFVYLLGWPHCASACNSL